MIIATKQEVVHGLMELYHKEIKCIETFKTMGFGKENLEISHKMMGDYKQKIIELGVSEENFESEYQKYLLSA